VDKRNRLHRPELDLRREPAKDKSALLVFELGLDRKNRFKAFP
jgi:hypothetical protein